MVCYKANMCEWYAVKQIPMDGMLLSVYQWMVCCEADTSGWYAIL